MADLGIVQKNESRDDALVRISFQDLDTQPGEPGKRHADGLLAHIVVGLDALDGRLAQIERLGKRGDIPTEEYASRSKDPSSGIYIHAPMCRETDANRNGSDRDALSDALCCTVPRTSPKPLIAGAQP